MTRWEPSVLRASAMAACAVTAIHLGRPARATRTLAIAVTALLVADPFLLHSVGFLLSCGASLGIALLAPGDRRPIARTRVVPRRAGRPRQPQIGVAPVLIPVFGSMPLVALPANLVAVPLAGPLTVWGLAAGAAVSGLIGRAGRGLTTMLLLPTRLMADGVLGVADAAGRVPLAIDLLDCARAGRSRRALVVLARPRRMLRPTCAGRSASVTASTTSPRARSSWASSTGRPTPSTTGARPSSSTRCCAGPSSWWTRAPTCSTSAA